MILSKAILSRYIEAGLIEARRHTSLPLTIYNYTRRCQYEASWDEVTLSCRGLITDDRDQIVARGFDKFFNYDELRQMNAVPISDSLVWVQKKVDGSLGILFHYSGEWHMATRGSFESGQARVGIELARAKYDLGQFDSHSTYLCEIVYPENRIVVDYGGESRLVFLSAIRAGEELPWEEAVALFAKSGIPEADIVETSQYSTFGQDLWAKLKSEQLANEEGFVIRFCPSGQRMKIKFDEYVRLHRLMTGFSNLDIWEELRAGNDPIERLGSVPDEFDEWIRAQIAELNREYLSVIARAHLYAGVLLEMGFETRREQAVWINERIEIEWRPLLFAILDNKRVEQIAWKIVKPEKRMPLRNQIED